MGAVARCVCRQGTVPRLGLVYKLSALHAGGTPHSQSLPRLHSHTHTNCLAPGRLGRAGAAAAGGRGSDRLALDPHRDATLARIAKVTKASTISLHSAKSACPAAGSSHRGLPTMAV